MLKSNKGYNLASNAKRKISTTFTKIMAVVLLTATLATAPAVLTSCGEETPIHESMPSVSEKEMNAFVADQFSCPIIGSLRNPTSIAYSFSASNGRVYKISIITTTEQQEGQVPVYLTTLEFPQGLTEKEIQRKRYTSSISFSNSTIKTFRDGESVDFEQIYSSHLGEEYIVAKEYAKTKDDGIEL